ncbi:MAG: DNA primase [bacterium]
MRGNVDTIKERLDIAEIVSSYVKLEKGGANLKARCPFHNEKTPSFMVSPIRQSFYCFGCGAKGDMFNFIEEIEGVDFRGALRLLADKAGVELKYESKVTKTEKDKVGDAIMATMEFYEKKLEQARDALEYLDSRGINKESIKKWHLGYAQNEWRHLYDHLISLGFSKEVLIKAGLIKNVVNDSSKDPYDVFRGRIIFPLFDRTGRAIAFSGRALAKDTEPKYLNSPDTILFNKSETLYGLDKAKEDIRKKNYAVLVEGQIDLVLSHQVGVTNVVASSGTAFTPRHLEKLNNLSQRIILAFDGDSAGMKAAEKSTQLGLTLGMEVKIASLPEGQDPAELIQNDLNSWKKALRDSVSAIEYFLNKILNQEKDIRKVGKFVEKKLLPLVLLVQSAIERAHFISLIAKRTGIREDMLWEDLRRAKIPDIKIETEWGQKSLGTVQLPRKSNIERRLIGIIFWQEGLPHPTVDIASLRGEMTKRLGEEYFEKLVELLQSERETLIFEAENYYSVSERLSKDIVELLNNLSDDVLRERLSKYSLELSRAEMAKDEEEINRLSVIIQGILREMATLEGEREKM